MGHTSWHLQLSSRHLPVDRWQEAIGRRMSKSCRLLKNKLSLSPPPATHHGAAANFRPPHERGSYAACQRGILHHRFRLIVLRSSSRLFAFRGCPRRIFIYPRQISPPGHSADVCACWTCPSPAVVLPPTCNLTLSTALLNRQMQGRFISIATTWLHSRQTDPPRAFTTHCPLRPLNCSTVMSRSTFPTACPRNRR